MRPRRTVRSNTVFGLDGGTEDNDLWARAEDDPARIVSVWEPNETERRAIADGANIELTVYGEGHPPVAIHATYEKLGKGERDA